MRNSWVTRERTWELLPMTVAAVPLLFFAATILKAQSAPSLALAPARQTSVTQSSKTPDWQIAAGGKLQFDVASVKPDAVAPSPQTTSSNFPLGPGDAYSPNGGLFTATNLPLFAYIAFAYKVMSYQTQVLLDQVPKWVVSDRYDIQARAAGNPTKDQMRLMMQTMLADRFKLTVHTETRELPVFAVVLVKPGKTGPQLQPHPKDSSCAVGSPAQSVPDSAPAPQRAIAAEFVCGGIGGGLRFGRGRAGARKVSMALIANTLTGMGNLDRPVLDQTGLSGTFDFLMEWTAELNGPLPPGVNTQIDQSGPTFLEALKEQLGLKLESQTGAADVIVVDHVEQPSEN
jgi:uncharacterized protein (TIGR03435 family)